jgi:hyperosmotically inducible periplasmic protein
MISSPVMKRVARAGFAAALLCGVVACATGPRQTDAQRQADKEIAQRVQTALDADKQLYAKHIFVRSYNGVVELTGFVWDPPDLLEAQTVAETVQGVSKVVNNLELQLNGLDNSDVSY